MAYPISYRQLEEMMGDRGVEVVHSTLNHWVLKYAPLLEQEFRMRKSVRSAAATLAGIKLMHMIRRGQLRTTGKLRPAQQFYSLAG
jgi:transposase-like protein